MENAAAPTPSNGESNVTKEAPIRVLCVDDETRFLSSTKQILQLKGPFSVETASSVNEALQKMQNTEFDVVVSDYMMPEKNGLEFLKELREKSNNIPFILFTGQGREEVAIKALNLGADRYFNKFGHPETVYGELAHGIRQSTAQRRAEKQIWDREERLRAIVASSPDAMIVTDLKGNITDCNIETLKLLEVSSKKDVIGTNCSSLSTSTDKEMMKEASRTLLKEGAVHNTECVFLTRKGNRVQVEYSANILRDAYSRPIGAVVLARDITERKKAEEKLRQSETKFREFFENTPVYCYMVSPEGKILEINRSALTALGHSREELVGKPLISAVYASSSQRKAKNLIKKWKNGEDIKNEELEILTKKGKKRKIVLDVHSVNDVHGKLLHSVSVQRDVTEKSRADEELRKSEEKYRNIVELAPDGIATMDMKGTITSVNRAFLELTGFSEDEIVGKHFTKLGTIRLKDIPRYVKIVGSVLKGKKLGRIEFDYVCKDGTPRLGEARIGLFKENGKTVGLQAVLSDITERKEMEQEIRDSEEKYRSVVENAPDGIISLDQQGVITHINKAILEQTGFSEKEFLGKHFTQLAAMQTENSPEFIKEVESFLQGKIPETVFDFFYCCKNGNVRVAEASIGLLSQNNKRAGIQLFLRDITERKEAEESLTKQRETLEKVTGNLSAALVMLSKDYRILWANKFIKSILGDITGKKCYSTINNSKQVCSRCKIKEVFETGEQAVHEQPVRNQEGKEILLEITAIPVKDKKGNITEILELAIDVTERRKAEEAIKQSEKRFRELSEMLPEVVFETDFRAMVIYANHEAYNKFGYTKEEFENGINAAQFIAPEQRDTVKRNHVRLMSGEKTGPTEYMAIRKDGTTFPIIVSSSPVYRGNKVVGARGILVDITDHIKTENALKETLKQMETLNEKLGVVGKLTRHDAQNKLSTIVNNAFLVKRELEDSQAPLLESLTSIETSVDQIEKIFEFSRLYEMLGTQELSPVNVKKSLEEAVLLTSGSDKVKVTNECKGLTVNADSLLRQIFYNLIDNSLKHGEKVTKIKVHYKEEPDSIKIVYEDDGVGVAEDQKEVIFKEGYGKGTGYGLYLISKICEEYGWTIRETSKPGNGAKFEITVPKLDKNGESSYTIKKP